MKIQLETSTIRERDIDLLLEEMHSSTSFRQWMGERLKYIPEFPHYTERKRTGFLPDAQYQKLTEECGKIGLWMRAMFEMGVTYGWRAGELLNLKVANVDLLSRTIRLEPGTTKNGEGREVATTPAVFELLRECVAGKNPEDHVFTRGKGKPVADFRGTWHRVCIAAGLGKMFCATCSKDILESKKHCPTCKARLQFSGLIFHDLRRTAARNLRRAGVAEEVIMKIGGWKTASVFKRYSIVAQSDITDAMQKLSDSRAVVEVQSKIDYKIDYNAPSEVQNRAVEKPVRTQ